MSSSPGGLLQRLRELKQWQASHDELLKRKEMLSDSQNTIEGLSAFDSSTGSDRNWESTPIAPSKSFDELLEEKLAEDSGPAGANARPKKPFLKRGQGLQRFRMGAKPVVTKPNNRSRDNGNSTNDDRFKGNAVCNLIDDVTPLKMPEIGMVVEPKATWCRVSENGAIQKINEFVNNGNSVQSDGPSEQTLYERQLEKELLLFEALERKVENSSFDSTNSSVIGMLSSTPRKNRTKSKSGIKHSFPEPVSEERRVRFFEDEPEAIVVGKTKETQVLSQLLTRLQKFKTQQPAVPPLQLIDCNEHEKWSTTSDGDDDDADESTSLSTTISSTDLEESRRNSCRDVAIGTLDDFPSPADEPSRKCPNCDEELRRKIQEYNERIKNVVEEKQKLLEMRKELDRRREADERDARKKRQEFHEERRTLEMEIENERKKLAKERAVFQTHIKDSQNRTTKKEREDISNLKQEVADLKETLKLKESKNGMTQARLRNQVKQLERDNATLKDQVEKLTRENAKLTATQKMTSARRPSDTKILHEINKNISKLTQEKQQKETTTTKNRKSFDDEEEQDEEEEKPTVATASRNLSKAKSKNNNNNNSSSRKEMVEIIMGVNNRSCNSGDASREMDMTNFRSVDVEKRYEQIFQQNASLNDSKKNDRTEEILEDGSKEIKYGNGNVKCTSADGNLVTMKYFNGDIKKTNLLDGTIKYFFFDQNIWQHSEPDGLEIIEFSDGSKEKRYKDGTCEVIFPDGTFQTIHRDGNQEVRYPDGSRLDIRGDGDKVLHLPNGQREIQTKEHKRREYPDGTVKILYPNGTQETRYATGRIRIKDPQGNLIMDTLEQQ